MTPCLHFDRSILAARRLRRFAGFDLGLGRYRNTQSAMASRTFRGVMVCPIRGSVLYRKPKSSPHIDVLGANQDLAASIQFARCFRAPQPLCAVRDYWHRGSFRFSIRRNRPGSVMHVPRTFIRGRLDPPPIVAGVGLQLR